jgi:predicted amidophosphoribosyltransferase
VIAIHPVPILGRWTAGVALDVHTIKSTYLGDDEQGRPRFDTERSEIGELLHRLKYKGDGSASREIIEAAVGFLTPRRDRFDVIVPVPPSAARSVQPVILIASGVARALGAPLVDCIEPTRAASQLKDVVDPARRAELLTGLYRVDSLHTAGKNVLLFDDLFRSGATMNAITEVLLVQGEAASVRALTITRTRSHQ